MIAEMGVGEKDKFKAKVEEISEGERPKKFKEKRNQRGPSPNKKVQKKEQESQEAGIIKEYFKKLPA